MNYFLSNHMWHTKWVLVALILFSCGHAMGQKAKEKKTPYYFDVNKGARNTIHEMQDELLHLKYYDAYGKEKELTVKLYNWKQEELATYRLVKEFGLNYFTVNLGSHFKGWQLGEVYTIKMVDEGSHHYGILLKKVPLPDKEDPVVSIFVNPLHMDCESMLGNVVEFYGKIEGGKAPYKTSWYVLNEKQTDFLYQPRQQVLEKQGKTMVIQVDKNPSYYVMLHVKDACGNEAEQIVNLVCQKSDKKVNTLFIERNIKSIPIDASSKEKTN